MHVVATAGHVDHGKSALVRALTGMEPDRWAEERRRGMTIDLGYAWTSLPSGATAAFVDVPGHERFASNMLAGLGPARAVLFVVAADGGWSAQSAEHLAAADALGVRHGVLAVTRTDLADPAPATAQALERLCATSLRDLVAVGVSSRTGAGLDALRDALDAALAAMPEPTDDARLRIWVDRSFTARGHGTIVTGTLVDGTVRLGDRLCIRPSGQAASVRGIECLKQPVATAAAPARVALNLRGVAAVDVRRGDALVRPDAWLATTEVDARLVAAVDRLPRTLTLHVGSAAHAVAVRQLGPHSVRLRLPAALPLQPGDRGVLYEPGARRVVAGVEVADIAPPPLRRRGAAAARGHELAASSSASVARTEIARAGAVRRTELLARGLDVAATASAYDVVRAGEWLVATAQRDAWAAQLDRLLSSAAQVPAPTAVQQLRLPDPALLHVVLAARPGLRVVGGHIVGASAAARTAPQETALQQLLDRLDRLPFGAPPVGELAAAGLSVDVLRAAARAGELVEVTGGVYLRPDAPGEAMRRLAALPQPFTLTDARRVLDAPRRVAVPLLEWLDARDRTVRVGPELRRVVPRG